MKVKKSIGKKLRAAGTAATKKRKGLQKTNEYVLKLEAQVATLKAQLAAQVEGVFLEDLDYSHDAFKKKQVDELPHLIKQQVDQEFLKELVEQARKYGSPNDFYYNYVVEFVEWCFEQAGKTPPTDEELEPYEEE